jgi:hypothetical protein
VRDNWAETGKKLLKKTASQLQDWLDKGYETVSADEYYHLMDTILVDFMIIFRKYGYEPDWEQLQEIYQKRVRHGGE